MYGWSLSELKENYYLASTEKLLYIDRKLNYTEFEQRYIDQKASPFGFFNHA